MGARSTSGTELRRIVELRGEGLSFKKIGKPIGIAAWTASRYVRSFDEGHQ